MSNEFDVRRKIDEICNQFEEEWSTDMPVEIAPILEHVDSGIREPLMRALLEVDVELRGNAGMPIDPNDYRQLGDSAVAIVEELIAAANSPIRGEASIDAAPSGTTSSSIVIGRRCISMALSCNGVGRT